MELRRLRGGLVLYEPLPVRGEDLGDGHLEDVGEVRRVAEVVRPRHGLHRGVMAALLEVLRVLAVGRAVERRGHQSRADEAASTQPCQGLE